MQTVKNCGALWMEHWSRHGHQIMNMIRHSMMPIFYLNKSLLANVLIQLNSNFNSFIHHYPSSKFQEFHCFVSFFQFVFFVCSVDKRNNGTPEYLHGKPISMYKWCVFNTISQSFVMHYYSFRLE